MGVDVFAFIDVLAKQCVNLTGIGGTKNATDIIIDDLSPQAWVRYAVLGHPVPKVNTAFKFKAVEKYCYDSSMVCAYSGKSIAFTNAYCITRVGLSNPNHDIEEMWISKKSFTHLSLLL